MQELVFSQVNMILSTVVLIPQDAAAAGGMAGAALAAAVITLDFVYDDWVGAACGAVIDYQLIQETR